MTKNRMYFDNFSSWTDVCKNFKGTTWSAVEQTYDQIIEGMGPEPKYIFAAYGTPSYEGYATVIFYRDGKWYQVEGGHCSCYGLEDQWKPEEFDPALYFKGIAEGKRLVNFDGYREMTPTNEQFDHWLKLKSALTKKAAQ